MVWTRPGNDAPDIRPMPIPATTDQAVADESATVPECSVCQRSSLWRDPLLLLAIAGVLVLWFRDVDSRLETQHTQHELDLAIRGNGHFQILLPNGEFAYTRFGRFALDEHGQVVTAEGYQIQPPLSIPDGTQSVTVGADGTVSVVSKNAPNAATVVGNLGVALFANPQALVRIEPGRPYFEETSAAGLQSTFAPGTHGVGELSQGWLEGRPWLSDSSLLRLGLGLVFALLVRMLSEMRRQRRQIQMLMEQQRHAVPSNSLPVSQAA